MSSTNRSRRSKPSSHRQNPTPPASSDSYASSFDDASRPSSSGSLGVSTAMDSDYVPFDTPAASDFYDNFDGDTSDISVSPSASTNRRRSGTPRRSAARLTSRAVVASPLRSGKRLSSSMKQLPSPVGRRDRDREREVRGRAKMRSKAAEPSLMQRSLETGGSFGMQVLGNALWMVKTPLAWALAFYLLAVLLAMGYRYAANLLFTTVCGVPGISALGLPFCEDSDAWGTPWGWSGSTWGNGKRKEGATVEDFPRLIDLQGNFESVLESSAGGTTMALDLKSSEVAVRDLNLLVRVSDLVCREQLSSRLDDFVTTAKSTSRNLQRFGSRVNGVVDSLLAMDEYAIRALESAQTASASSSSGSSITSLLLSPFRSSYDLAAAEHEILTTFIQASSIMDTSIKRLIHDASSVVSDLDELESRLLVISEIAHKEKAVLSDKEQAVLAEIWTLLGGNRRKLANFSSHRALLGNIGSYRNKALAHVTAGLLTLQQMQSDLEELRERVAQPALVEDAELRDKVPLEVHVQSIRRGVDRLKESMERSKERERSERRAKVGEGEEMTLGIDR